MSVGFCMQARAPSNGGDSFSEVSASHEMETRDLWRVGVTECRFSGSRAAVLGWRGEGRRDLLTVFGLVAVVGFVLSGRLASADLLEGRVVGIADGDTLTGLDGDQVQHRIRLTGIDAPERAQPFGERSR